MVLRPIFDSGPVCSPDAIPAWSAVEQQQTAKAPAWWLITQADHAGLSGEIAGHFSGAGFPHADQPIATAIATHDAGWNLFESDPHQPPRLHPDGRPISFFEVQPHDFLRAWTASIDRAQEDSASGAYLSSRHFSWLGEFRLQRGEDAPAVQQQVRDFLAQEQIRQRELKRSVPDATRWDDLLPLLQFCDLLSLYLCSGSRQPVEFPQEFPAGRIRARYEGDLCVLTPSPFAQPWTSAVRAVRYPSMSPPSVTTLSLSLR